MPEDPNSPQDTFTLLRLRGDPGQLNVQLLPGVPQTGHIDLVILADVDVSGVTAEVEGVPPNVSEWFDVPDTVPAGAAVPITYTLTAADESVPQATIHLHVLMPVDSALTETDDIAVKSRTRTRSSCARDKRQWRPPRRSRTPLNPWRL